MAEETKKQEVVKIPIGKIKSLPGLDEAKEPEKALGTMVSSIALKGIETPVVLREIGNGEYQLVDGYRRKRAAELARLKEIPVIIYDMTEQEASAYRAKLKLDPETPIPGKPKETPVPEKFKDAAKDKPPAPAADAAKAPEKPKEEKAPDKAAPAKADAPAASKADKPKEVKEDKLKEPEAKKPPEVKKTEPPKENKAAAPTAKNEEKAAPEKAPEPKAEEAKAPVKNDTKPKAEPPKEEKPVGKVADGPVGTVITKVLPDRRNPPTEKDKKDFPKPGEGETFSVTLHPAYLKKSPLNTFSVDRQSDDFQELYKSIQRFGVKDPVLTRIGADGELEILSGQRRHIIASELNYPVPTIIQQLDDDDAKILMADGNLHRETISTYDKAIALKMKAEGMKRKAGRRSKGYTGPKLDTDEALAAEMGMTVAKLNRLMKLSEATEGICGLVDEGKLTVTVAYNIAFLPKQAQEDIVALMGINSVKVNSENTTTLKNLAKTEKLDYNKVKDVLNGKYPPPKVVEIPKSPTPAPATPSMAPTGLPKSPDVPSTANPVTVIPFTPNMEAKQTGAPAVPAAPAATPPVAAVPVASPVEEKGQDRENSHTTKVILTGDRLRKYFPDVTMTPREIEDSVYDALEERRVRQEKLKQKAEITKPKGGDAR